MQQGFHFFLAACNFQRQLLIAVECLHQQLEAHENGWIARSDALTEALMNQIVELSESIATQVNHLAVAMSHDAKAPGSALLQPEIEAACQQLIDTNLSVAQTALAVIGRYGFAPWAAQALAQTAKRHRSIQARLSGQGDGATRLPT